MDLNLVREALRHQNISTTLGITYAGLGRDAARHAMEDHGKPILEAAGRRGPLAVVEGGAGKKVKCTLSRPPSRARAQGR